jgi:two-component system, NarL family, response regulator NreC
MNPIRLMLVDDHDLVRTSLKAFLDAQAGMLVVAEASNGQDALRLAQESQPNVTIMDITMPGVDGLETTRRMRAACPECKVLALTVHSDKQYFFEMLSAGAAGYVTKDAAAEDLLDAIRAVADGQVYLQPALASWLLDDYRRLLHQTHQPTHGEAEVSGKGLDVLSDREIQVLELVADGMTNSEIGEALGISPKTVARHRERIMDKLDIHSSTELVKFAIRKGLITLG